MHDILRSTRRKGAACVDFQNKWTNFFSLNETI